MVVATRSPEFATKILLNSGTSQQFCDGFGFKALIPCTCKILPKTIQKI
jgi:hypothetical protein